MGILDNIDDPQFLSTAVGGSYAPQPQQPDPRYAQGLDMLRAGMGGGPLPPNLQNPAVMRPPAFVPQAQQQQPMPPMRAQQPAGMMGPSGPASGGASSALSFAPPQPGQQNPLSNVPSTLNQPPGPPAPPPSSDNDETPTDVSSQSRTGATNGGIGAMLAQMASGGTSANGADQTSNRMRGALAGGLQNVGKNYGWTGLGAFAGGAGGALGGYDTERHKDVAEQHLNTQERLGLLDRAIKLKAEGDNAGYRDSMIQYHNAMAQQGRFQLQTFTDPNGNQAIYKLNTRDGSIEKVFEGAVSRSGGNASGTGQGSVFQQRLSLAQKLWPDEPERVADYAAGRKTVSPADAMKYGMTYAQHEAENNPQVAAMQADARQKWVKDRATEVANTITQADKTLKAQQQAPTQPSLAPGQSQPQGGQQTPASPAATGPAPKPPENMKMEGNGTQAQPYKMSKPEDYNDIVPGAYFVDPQGNVRLKK